MKESHYWNVTVPTGQTIQLGPIKFEVSPGDVFQIFDGPDEDANQIYTNANNGPDLGTIFSSTNSLFITFTTDGTVRNVGFMLIYVGV